MAEWHEVVCEGNCEYVAVSDPGGLAQDGAVCVLEIGEVQAAPEDPEAMLIPLTEGAVLCLVEGLLKVLCLLHAEDIAPRLEQPRSERQQ